MDDRGNALDGQTTLNLLRIGVIVSVLERPAPEGALSAGVQAPHSEVVSVDSADGTNDSRGQTGPALGPIPAPERRAARWLKPGWPLAAIFVPFPLWWALGMSEFACLIFAIPMVFELVKRRTVTVPRGFGWWLLFLAWVAIGVAVLHVDAVGAVADSNATRYLTWVYRLCWYLAITTVGVYVVTMREKLSTVRVARIVSILFLTVVAGGVLGVLLPHFEFTSALELILPKGVAETPFINRMIHPSAAQLQDVLGYSAPRPSAPYSYTNTWGLNYALTLPFFLYAWLGKDGGWRRYVAPLILGVSAVPVIYSINRGLWAALLLVGVFVAARAALSGRPGMMVGVIFGSIAVVTLVVVTSLGSVVETRLSNAGSEQGRTNLGTLSLTSVAATSPVIGLGSTRNVQGNFNTITGGSTAACPRCSPPALGTQGQLWLVVFSQGILGLLFYLVFFGLAFARGLRLRSPTATMSLTVLAAGFITMPVYNSLGSALMVIMIAVALLSREFQEGGERLPTFAEYFLPLKQRIGLVLLVALLGLDLAALWQQFHGVRYSATQTMLVPDSRRLPSGGYGPMSLDTEAQLLSGRSVTEAIRRATGTTLQPDQQDLRVVARPNTRVVDLSFRANSPESAVKGVAAASRAFLEEREAQLNSELKDEMSLLNKQASGLDSSVRVLDDVLQVVGDTGSRIPLVETRNTREVRWNLLTRIQQVNFQMNRISSTPTPNGSYLDVIRVEPQNDVWNVSLASGLMIGLLFGSAGAMVSERRGARLQRPAIVLRETGLPVLATVPKERRMHRVVLGRRTASSTSTIVQLSLGVKVFRADVVVPLGRDSRLSAVTTHLKSLAARERHERDGGVTRIQKDSAGPRVIIVISSTSRADDLNQLSHDLSVVGNNVVGVILCL